MNQRFLVEYATGACFIYVIDSARLSEIMAHDLVASEYLGTKDIGNGTHLIVLDTEDMDAEIWDSFQSFMLGEE